jgi:predicted alpha/beta-fold hydrolase
LPVEAAGAGARRWDGLAVDLENLHLSAQRMTALDRDHAPNPATLPVAPPLRRPHVELPDEASSFWERVRGHAHTLIPHARQAWVRVPRTEPWSTVLEDPQRGAVRLTGRYLRSDSAAVVLIIHGLGGQAESGYVSLALRACHRARRSCLLLNLRGADRQGEDIAHAGLTADVAAALHSPLLREAPAIDILGYSLGGHVALRYASGEPHPRLRRVAAIGAPLLLGPGASALDAPRFSVYRMHILRALHAIYAAVHARRGDGIRPAEARRIHRIREWDARVVVPRFGYRDPDDYYAKESVAPHLGRLCVDTLYVGACHDPVVARSSVLPALPAPRLRTVWDERAGHVAFGPRFDLGCAAPLGLENQVLAWLAGDPGRV